MSKYINIICVILLVIAVACIIDRCSASKQVVITGKDTKTIISYKDTSLQHPDINLDSLKNSLITYRNKYVYVPVFKYLTDSTVKDSLLLDTIQVLPFVSQLDTIINHDTIGIRFLYPENLFTLSMKLKPDYIREKLIKITETITVEKKEAWYIKPAIFLTGGLLGYIGGRLQK